MMSLMSLRDFHSNMTIWICMPLQCGNTHQVLLLSLAYSKPDYSLTMAVSVNRLGLEVILKYIQCSGKCSVGLDTFTFPYMSGTQLVQSMFTIQHGYRALPSLSLVVSWWLQTNTPLQQWSCFFSAILLITLRAFLVDWNLSERALHAFPLPSPCLFVLSPWKLQSFWWKHIIVRGWAVSAFTMPAPLCVFP